MGRACCVLGCTSGGDAPSHQIPKNPDLFRKWKNMIYSEKIQHLTDEQISKCTVCYRHFANEDYLVTYRVRKLKRGIAPSLNLPNRPVKRNMTTGLGASTTISTETTSTIKVKKEDTTVVRLFEDLPETLGTSLLKQSSVSEETIEQSFQQFDMKTKRMNLVEECEASFRTRISRRKRARLTEKQSVLLQYKKQAEKYAKTSTIRKLLSLVTATERSSLQSKIQKSKYSPRIYIKLYHDIAKRKALSQL